MLMRICTVRVLQQAQPRADCLGEVAGYAVMPGIGSPGYEVRWLPVNRRKTKPCK